ncbi:hypothetical protein BU15DRAFT_76006 [Melanogaster broomeanus]|nr:hypothetical protein BU15DRAFT_76006 [Melanogaster broomeanus]
MSSAGRSRRLSDARDAATRPSTVSLQTTSALSSLAALSLASPAMSHRSVNGAQQSLPNQTLATSTNATFESGSLDDKEPSASLAQSSVLGPTSGTVSKSGKKRGTIFTCESCSKVYRHPSCLIKHRWEHTPHWREASKFVLSKHQQVQLLEAAAILSHLSPSSASLPDDRSLWPSFLSGGVVPPPAPGHDINPAEATTSPSSIPASHPVSSSVPATSLLNSSEPGSTGPPLHDYSVPRSVSGVGGLTQLRPGLLGIPTVSPSTTSPSPSTVSWSAPMPVPAPTTTDDALNLLALRSASVKSESYSSPTSSFTSAYNDASLSSFSSYAYAPSETGCSLPRSSLRSMSTSSRSRSASESKSDEDGDLVDVDGNEQDESTLRHTLVHGLHTRARSAGAWFGWKMEDEDGGIGFSVREEDEEEDGKVSAKAADEEWDGLEMEMEMD